MKLLLSLIIYLILLTNVTSAAVTYLLEDFTTPQLKSELEFIDYNKDRFVKFQLSPNFKFEALEVGFDLNIFTSLNDSSTPAELQSLVLRKVAYRHYDIAGFEWGRLTNVQFGYGLLVDNYDTGSFGSTSFNNKKAGFKAFYNFNQIGVEGMWTGTNVVAGRLHYTFYDSPILGSPVKIGVNYIVDRDGVDETVASTRITRPKQSGYSIDVGLPIAGDFLTLYTEYAQMAEQQKGKGISSGLRGYFFDIFNYRFEYRVLGAYFVPGYFNSTYEATSFSFITDAPKTRLSGYVAGLGMSFLGAFQGRCFV